jgi:hypothetical protein
MTAIGWVARLAALISIGLLLWGVQSSEDAAGAMLLLLLVVI